MRNYKRKNRNGFTMFHSNWNSFEMLTDAEAGSIIKAAFRYSMTGELPERFPDRMLNSVWALIQRDIDYSIDAWTEKCTQNAYTAYRRVEKENNREPLDREAWEETYISEQAETGSRGVTPVTPCHPMSPPVDAGSRGVTGGYQYKDKAEDKAEHENEDKAEDEVEKEIELSTKFIGSVKGLGSGERGTQNFDNAQTDTQRTMTPDYAAIMETWTQKKHDNENYYNQRNAYLEADEMDKLV